MDYLVASQILWQSLSRVQLPEYSSQHWHIQKSGPWYSAQDSCLAGGVIRQKESMDKVADVCNTWLFSPSQEHGHTFQPLLQWDIASDKFQPRGWILLIGDCRSDSCTSVKFSYFSLALIWLIVRYMLRWSYHKTMKPGLWEIYGEELPFCPHWKYCVSENWNVHVLNHWDFKVNFFL